MNKANTYSVLKEMPRQKLTAGAKDKAWQEACVDAVISDCNTYGRSRRSDSRTKLRNYNIFNGKLNREDFEYVLNPYNLSKDLLNAWQFPASLQPYDVISPLFMLLFGEEAKRPFDPIAVAVNSDAINQKLQQKKDMVLQALQQMLAPQDPNSQEPPPTPEQVLNYAHMNVKDMREKTAQYILNYYTRKLDTSNIFQTGWKDALIAGEELYSIDEVANALKFRRVNPLELHFVLPPNSDEIDACEKIYERNKMSVSQIVDEFYEILTPTQIDDLENFRGGLGTVYNYSLGGPSVDTYFGPTGINVVNSIFDLDDTNGEYGIDVHRVRWKSKRKMGTYHFIDPQTQLEQEMLVDEYFKIKSTPDEWIEWFWINEYWEGVRIGQDMYLNVRPRKNQFRSVDNLSECKSGYVGTVYNAQNSQSVSLMDRVYPWLCLYLIVWYRTELLLAANMGKIALVDTSLIPDGWEMEKWLYYAQSMKIGFVNSYNEGSKGERIGRVNQSTQTKALDVDTGQSIQYNIKLLEYIEQKMKDTAGVTDQRLGAISASEQVGNAQRSVVQSSHITEEWFRVHNNTKLRVCETIVNVAKELTESKVMQYINDDMATILFEVDPEELSDADFGVFITNNSKDQEALSTLKQLLQTALQNDKISLAEVVDIINSNSLATLKTKLKQSEAERIQQSQEMEKQRNELQAQAQQVAQENFDKDLAMKQYIADSNNQTKLAVAEITSFIGQEDLDQDDNGIVDPIEIANLNLKQLEINSKENLEKLKIQQTDVQNRSQEKIAQDQIKFKEKELKSKEKIAKISARAKPKPASKK